MAKKKKRKEPSTKEKDYMIEIKGILLLLVAIIGCCPFKPVSDIIKGFAAFLVGTWWAVLLVLVGLSGVFMIIRRKRPNFFTAKLVGLYIIIVAILMLSHAGYIKSLSSDSLNVNNFKIIENGQTVIVETVNNMLSFVTKDAPIQGGGIIGAFFSSLFVGLLTLDGMVVVGITLIICGLIMFTGISIYDVLKKAGSGVKKVTKSMHHHPKHFEIQDEVVTTNVNDNVDNHIIISSIDELKGNETHEEVQEVKQENAVVSEETFEDNKKYAFPPISLLNKPSKTSGKDNQEAIKVNVPILTQVLQDFGIEGKVVAAHVGPAVTQYELEIKAGTKVNKILSLNREIALALAAKDVRIQAPIPGKSTIGIELPNKSISMVNVREVLVSVPATLRESKLLSVLGRDIMGEPRWMEINKTPHLLVAGSTGSGKSVCVNSILASILMRAKPDEVKLVLVDPKKVELSIYNGIPHLMVPVVTDPKKANIVLKKIVSEMERRYDVFEESKTKNITSYNSYIDKQNEGLPENDRVKRMPYIVVIIDELADLMLVAAKEVEDSIMRITQMARAAGIHLIVATQRPSTDVITGVVKANIPSRISFAVSSGIDSRTILDMVGAEKLLGKGDMLYLPQGENVPIRIQGTFISEDETKAIVDYVCSQQKAHYDNSLTMDEEEHATTMVEKEDDYEEPLYNEIVEFVVTQGKASASLLQRRFRLGYNRAARAIDLLEDRGIVGPPNGSKPREVLVKLNKDE
ncbi:MAG: DNA translocase FtsK [Bacilli bacterium]|nr:DNA translocase FtsK [Bacilli bacterium]